MNKSEHNYDVDINSALDIQYQCYFYFLISPKKHLKKNKFTQQEVGELDSYLNVSIFETNHETCL